jgi:hypothetical protein
VAQVLSPEQALALLGVAVETEPAQGALGQAQVRARGTREGQVVAVTLRDNEGDAITALYNSVSQAPARRTRTRR